MKKLGIYIHIPFCVRKCFYCDFLSAPSDEETRERYVKSLCREIKQEARAYEQYQVDTIFFGGGTPSLLTAEQIQRIMDTVRGNYSLQSGKEEPEITMEVNPGTVTFEKLCGYKKAGINRLSIGLQSVRDEELKALGRIHTFEEFKDTWNFARKAGFSNINVDLMSALPGQSVENWRESLEKAAALGPEHISAYSLIVEEGTLFFDWYEEKTVTDEAHPPLPDEDKEREMYKLTEEFLKQYGYHRYEISNYAKEGKECRHNRRYWQRENYAGFGLGAASMVENVRWSNTRNLQQYLEANRKEDRQVLSEKEQMEEFMFLGLRLTKGVSAQNFYRQFGKEIESVYGQVLTELMKEKLLLKTEEAEETRYFLSPYGTDVSNYCMAQFLLD